MKHACWLISLYLFAVLVDAKPGDVRIDENPSYWGYQDIKQALNNADKKSWLFYRTLRNSPRSKNTCVYADVKGKEDDGKTYEFEQGYKTGDGSTVTKTLFAIPYKTENPEGTTRQKENAMRVKENKDNPNGKRYKLIYSDYHCCDVLRALEDENEAACELYLHDNCISKAVPKDCAALYGNACGTDASFRNQVYYASCKNTTEVPTEPTTKAPDHEITPKEPPPQAPETPEETPTTSTLPPGC
uniref:Putative salivary lipocalin n=1 Tax=Ixodes ricinus TaxID=34613 RepID=A0A0K8R9C8_IXORI